MMFSLRKILNLVILTILGLSAYSQPCTISDVLVVNPLPIAGVYESGQTIEFCYTMTDWNTTASNWFNSVTPTLGPGWDATSLTPTSFPPGNWIWVNSITATSGSGVNVGPSFGFDSDGNGNPGDDFGDLDGQPWTFCWEVTVADCPPNSNGTSLNMVVNTGGDYETGSWILAACTSDPLESAYAEASCCPFPIVNLQQPVCYNDCTGEIDVDGNDSAPYDYELLNSLNTVISSSFGDLGTHTFQNLCSGSYTVQVTYGDGCVSSVPITIINPPDVVGPDENISSCNPVTVNGTVYSTSQSVVNTYSTVLGCDSTVTSNITILSDPAPTIIDASICVGQTYTEGSDTYSTSGTYSFTYVTAFGCDSVVTTNLTVDPPYAITNTVSICDGDSYTEGTSVYITTGIYTDNYLTSAGCDSIITTDLTVTSIFSTTNTVTICNGDSYTEGSSVYTITGVYTDNYLTSAGCDSVITTDLTVTSIFSTTNTASICDGDSYTEGTSVYTTTGIYTDSYLTSTGCDSIITTDLTVTPIFSTTNTVTICNGDSYTEGSSVYTITGIYTDSYLTSAGCDSVVTTILNVTPAFVTVNEPSICAGGSYTEGTSVYSTAGIYIDSYLTMAGCDSVITTILSVTDQFEVTNTVSICDDESYSEGSSVYTLTGIYQDVYISSIGCDSVVTTDLTVNEASSISNQVSICDGESYTEGSSVYISTGLYTDSYITSFGCDSIVITDLTVTLGYSTSNDVNICIGGSYTEGTSVYTDAGTYVDSYLTVAGCDSVITTVLTVIDQFEVTNQASICEGESYTEGSSIYTLTGIYQDVYTSSNGCDSVVTTDLTIEMTSSIINQVSICEDESYTEGSSIYTESGEYLDIYAASNGCDSAVTTILSIYATSIITNSIEICLGETYSEGTSVYDETGVYTDIYADVNGCDSIVNTDLTVTNCCEPYATFIQMRFCESLPTDTDFVFILPGIFDSTFVAIDGCDSIVTTEVILDPSYLIVDEIDICEGSTYTIGNEVYDTSGIYSLFYETTQGCDSIFSTDLEIHSPSSLVNDLNLCEGEILIVGNSIYDQAGIFVDSLQSQIGCDSVVTSIIAVVDSPITVSDTTICEGDTFFEGGIQYDQTGIYTHVYPSAMGCDSTVITTLFVGQVYEEEKEVRICEGESHFEGESEYREDGIYYDIYSSGHGCDSVITTILEVVRCHCSVFTPNAVTADGDEINDSFHIGYDCEFYEYELMIFNRWGEVIFSTGDPDAKWVPSLVGSEYYAPDGMYTYLLQYSYMDGSHGLPVGPIRKMGSITVLR